jgi:hypothetical protein
VDDEQRFDPGTDSTPQGLDEIIVIAAAAVPAPPPAPEKHDDGRNDTCDVDLSTPNGLDFTFGGAVGGNVSADVAGVQPIHQIQVTKNLADIDQTKALAVYTIQVPCVVNGPPPGSLPGVPAIKNLSLPYQVFIAVYP